MINEVTATERYVKDLQAVLEKLPWEQIEAARNVLREARKRGATIFVLGNGGSASTASHMVADMGKNTIRDDVPRMRMIALTDNVEAITAWGNDSAYSEVFAEQLTNLVRPDDVVVAISGSGNSPNVLRAIEVAKANDATTIGITGFRGGKLAPMVEYPVVVPSNSMEMIEDVHLILNHALVSSLRQDPA